MRAKDTCSFGIVIVGLGFVTFASLTGRIKNCSLSAKNAFLSQGGERIVLLALSTSSSYFVWRLGRTDTLIFGQIKGFRRDACNIGASKKFGIELLTLGARGAKVGGVIKISRQIARNTHSILEVWSG